VVRSRRVIWAFAFSTAVALVLSSGIVRSQGDDADGDSIPDAIETATQRVVVALSKADELSITSRLVNPPYEDQFSVSFSAGTFEVDYKKAGGGISYRLEMRNLVQWVDENRNNRLDDGEVVGSVTLGNSAFGDVNVTHIELPNADGGRVHYLNITSRTGLVSLNLTVAERFMRLSPVRILTPMEVKMDIAVNRPVVVAGANLGIEFRMETEEEVEYSDRSWDDLNGFAVGDAAMNVTGGPPGSPAIVFFSWAKSATVDGRDIPVALMSSTGLETGEYDLYLLYLSGGQSIGQLVHDPTIGVRSEAFEGVVNRPPPLQADFLLYGGTLAAMAVLVIGTIVFANRRRKQREE